MKTQLTFIDLLNNPEHKSLIEQIEELNDTKEPILVSIRNKLTVELYRATGYSYDHKIFV